MSDYLHTNGTFLGKKLYLLMQKAGRYLSRHMWLWTMLNLTWGILGTLFGLLVAGFISVLPVKKRYSRIHNVTRITFGNNWGGLSGVFFIFVADDMGEWTDHVNDHEIGHTFQNAVLGPFCLLLVMIPSMIRYHIFNIRDKKGKNNPPYDSIWFEASATDVGTESVSYWEDVKICS